SKEEAARGRLAKSTGLVPTTAKQYRYSPNRLISALEDTGDGVDRFLNARARAGNPETRCRSRRLDGGRLSQEQPRQVAFFCLGGSRSHRRARITPWKMVWKAF